jgi:hypothetical protein
MRSVHLPSLAVLVAGLCAVLIAMPCAAATATVQTKAKASEMATSATAGTRSAGEEDLNPPVDVIIVWGFRVRSELYEERSPPLREGYENLVKKPECLTSVCGYVVFHDGQKWRSTNVLAGDEGRLKALQSELEYDRQTLVIVHPTGQKRTVPKF